MGGWANGIAAKELGTHLPGPMIWIGYRDSARYGLTTTLSLKDGAQQIWVEMDAATWRELIAEAEQAIHELWTASIDPEDIERFWSKVAVTDDPDACWLWQAGTTTDGYGMFSLSRDGETTLCYAHRFAYELTNGPLDPGVKVCHTCDTPPCANPAHLFAGTQRDNMRDMTQKGRHGARRHPERWARGERVNTAKLTEDQVREIRRRHAAGETTVALGPAFGVSQSLVSLIVRRKCWKHVD